MKFVFGVGIALANHWDWIRDFFNPDYALDNNEKKWGMIDSSTGLLCNSPKVLSTYENAEVLITIGDPYIVDAVVKQLEKYNVKTYKLVEQLETWGKRKELPSALLEKLTSNSKKILLFNTPEHNNIGDHLITLATLELLEELADEYEICEITDIEYLRYHNQILGYVGSEDIILVCGGGFMGSLWLYNGEQNIRSIIEEYRQNKICILPQTVFFEENERGKREYLKSKKIYNSHNNIFFFAREKRTYDILCEMIENREKVVLFPDLALMYNNKYQYRKENFVAVCLRSDKEKIADDKKRIVLDVLSVLGEQYKEISMHSDSVISKEKREVYVNEKLKEIGEASVVVTDTLHCMISAALTGTPCIAFDNITGKVKNVYEWIKDLGYIKFCGNISEFEDVFRIIDKKHNKYLFEKREEYKSSLFEIVNGTSDGR